MMDADDAAQMSFFSHSTEDWYSPLQSFLGRGAERVKKPGCAVSGTLQRHCCISPAAPTRRWSCNPALHARTQHRAKCQSKHLRVHEPTAP